VIVRSGWKRIVVSRGATLATTDDDDRVLARSSARGLRDPALGLVLHDEVVDVLCLCPIAFGKPSHDSGSESVPSHGQLLVKPLRALKAAVVPAAKP